MYRGLVLLFLVLVLETRWSESSCQQSESQRAVSGVSDILWSTKRYKYTGLYLLYGLSSIIKTSFHAQESPSFRLSAHNVLKRYNDIDYDSFVGLMGRRNAGEWTDIFAAVVILYRIHFTSFFYFFFLLKRVFKL